MRRFRGGGVSVGPTVAWATKEWTPEMEYELHEYRNAKPITNDEEEDDEEEEA